MHVLLVVDDKLAKAVKSALAADGGHVVVAPTPAQALALAKRRPPDCIVLKPLKTDEELQTFRQSLDQRCPGKAIPVISTKPDDSVEAIVKAIRESESTEDAASRKPAGPTVLLLDDRGIARKHLAAAIAAEGWRVVEAADAREATLKVLDESVDCFLLTAMLGGQSSAGLVKSASIIREVHPHPFSIVVLVDAEEGAGAANIAKSGVDDVIAKTTAVQVLVRRMTNATLLRDLRAENRKLRERLAVYEPETSAAPPGDGTAPPETAEAAAPAAPANLGSDAALAAGTPPA